MPWLPLSSRFSLIAGATGLVKRLFQAFTGDFLAPVPEKSSESVPAGAKIWNCQKYQGSALGQKKTQCELVWSCAAFRDASDAAVNSIPRPAKPDHRLRSFFSSPASTAKSCVDTDGAGGWNAPWSGSVTFADLFFTTIVRYAGGLKALALLTGDSIYQSARMTEFKHP
jgi:hypothetical protein